MTALLWCLLGSLSVQGAARLWVRHRVEQERTRADLWESRWADACVDADRWHKRYQVEAKMVRGLQAMMRSRPAEYSTIEAMIHDSRRAFDADRTR